MQHIFIIESIDMTLCVISFLVKSYYFVDRSVLLVILCVEVRILTEYWFKINYDNKFFIST